MASDEILVTYRAVPTGFDKVGVAVNSVTQDTKELQTQIKATFSDKALDEATGKMNAYGDAVEESTNKQKSLTAQLKELKKQIGTSTDPKEIKRLTAAAAELDDKIGDINKEVKKLGSDTRSFDTLITGARGIAAAFSVATGLAASFGNENKDLQKTLLKVQGAMAALQGVQELAAIATERGGLAARLAASAQAAYAFVVGESTGALKLFRLALAATGIGLIIIGIGTLVANWDKLKKAVTENSEGFQKFTESMKFLSPLLYVIIKPIQFIIQHLKELKEIIGGVGSVASLVFGNIGDTMAALLSGQFGKIGSIWKDFGKKSQEAFDAGRKEVRDKTAFDAEFEAAAFAVKLADASGKGVYEAKKKYLQLEIQDMKTRNEDTRLKEAELTKLIGDENKKRNDEYKKAFEERKKIETAKKVDNITAFELPDAPPKDKVKEFLKGTQDAINIEKAPVVNVDLKVTPLSSEEEMQNAAIKATKFFDDYAQKISNGVKAVSNLTSAIFAEETSQLKDKYDSQSLMLDKQKEQELKAAGDNATKKAAIEEKYAKRKLKLDHEQAIAAAKIAREQAIANKAFAIFNILLSTAQGIAKALEKGVAGIADAAIIGATGALELAAVAAQPLPAIPKFEKGGAVVLAGGRKQDGHLFGRSHRDGGMLINAQGGEYIWDIPSVQKHGDIIRAAHENRIEDLVLHKYVVPMMRAKEQRKTDSYDDWLLRATIKGGQKADRKNAEYIASKVSESVSSAIYNQNRYR